MLEQYFCNTRTLHQLGLGPLAGELDAIAEALDREGYNAGTARDLLRDISHLSRYLLWKGIVRIEDVKPSDIDDFLTNHIPVCDCMRPNQQLFRNMPSAMIRLRSHMTQRGFFRPDQQVEFAPTSVNGLLARYTQYLKTICGNSDKTIDIHIRALNRFLTIRERVHGSIDLEHLTKKEIVDIHSLLIEEHPYSLDWRSSTTSSLRSFLRFLNWERISDESFIGLLPVVRRWKLSSVPKALKEDELKALIASPDRTTAVGRRDYAVLVLLGTLGLRASEIVAMRLEDIGWRKRMITVRQPKTKKVLEMPVSETILSALKDYVTESRPKCECREVFVRTKAPVRPLKSSSAITSLVGMHMAKAGILRDRHKGAHALRHTFATLLVNKGVPIKDISDLLGHAHVHTTGIYAKVDLSSLRKISGEFPTCGWRIKA